MRGWRLFTCRIGTEVDQRRTPSQSPRSILRLGNIPAQPVVVPEGRHTRPPWNIVEVVAHHQSLLPQTTTGKVYTKTPSSLSHILKVVILVAPESKSWDEDTFAHARPWRAAVRAAFYMNHVLPKKEKKNMVVRQPQSTKKTKQKRSTQAGRTTYLHGLDRDRVKRFRLNRSIYERVRVGRISIIWEVGIRLVPVPPILRL